MAVTPGMLCLHCGESLARDGSHYCSDACLTAFMANMKGPVDCMYCDGSCDTVAKAKSNRWKEIEPAPEGISYNYSGICPECWKEHCR